LLGTNADCCRVYEIKVIARNRTTTSLMQDVFKKVTRERFDILRVFCLCSEEYAKHLSGYDSTDDERAPRLSIEATGYPQLRSFIAGGPSDGRWATLKHHVHNCYDTLFSTLEMASSMNKVQRKDAIIKLCQIKQQVCFMYPRIGFAAHSLTKCFKQALGALEELFTRFETEWVERARKGMGRLSFDSDKTL
jgi:hypothetical protein